MKLFERTKNGNLREINILGLKFKYCKKPSVPKHINRTKILPQILAFDKIGINADKRPTKLIVSLTSFPERMYEIHFTLYSLLNQSLKPDEVVLWLAKEQFPNGEKDLPEIVLKMQRNGLTIKWCEDLRSYKKLIPALKEFSNDVVVVVDDDVYYPKDWLKKLYNQHLKTPKFVIGHRGHKIMLDENGHPKSYRQWKKNQTLPKASYRNFMTGCGGVLYPPHSLYRDVTNVELFRKLAPYADDIWFWAMAVMAGTPINIVKNNHKQLIYVNPERELKLTNELVLTRTNTVGGDNDRKIQQVISYYPPIMDRLK